MTTASETVGGLPAGTDEPDALTYINRAAAPYLDRVATNLAGLKGELIAMLDPAPGDRVLDVGCGTGVDVFTLAERVGPTGLAVGVDSAPELVVEARSRVRPGTAAEFQAADACSLPFPDGSFERARSERVLQHVTDPGLAIRELARVTAPGGRVLVADPDHGMWAPDLADKELTRKAMAYWVDHIRNPWMGRQLYGLMLDAGLEDLTVKMMPIVMTSLEAADAVIGLKDTAATLVAEGSLSADEAERWHADLTERAAAGRLLVCGVIVAVHGRVPGA